MVSFQIMSPYASLKAIHELYNNFLLSIFRKLTVLLKSLKWYLHPLIPWYTSQLLELIDEREQLLADHQLLRSKTSKSTLKTISNKIKSLKRKLKKDHYQSKIEENKSNSKKLWELLKEVTRSQTDPLMLETQTSERTLKLGLTHYMYARAAAM